MVEKPKINVEEANPLKWPDGWLRTRIIDRRSNASWKKRWDEYKRMVVAELTRMGVSDVLITVNHPTLIRQDPGVAVYFSKALVADYSWQEALGIDNPAPTKAEIDAAMRRLAPTCHPDGPNRDDVAWLALQEHKRQAYAWIDGSHSAEHGYVIPCDKFVEARHNLCAVRLALTALRQLDRVGIPGMLERSVRGLRLGLPVQASSTSVGEK